MSASATVSTGYQPGSITSFLAASSTSSEKPPSSSKKTKLQALFEKPNVAAVPVKQTAAADHKRKKDVTETAPEESSKKKRKRDSQNDDGSKLVLAREEGLRNADVKETKSKKRKKIIKTNSTDDSTDVLLSGEKTNLKNSDNARKRVESKTATPKKSGYVRPTEPEKDQRTVFVGNVALTVDKKMLQKMFKSCGKVESVRIRSVPVSTLKIPKRASAITKEFHPQRHNMNAYVTFDTRESAEKSLKFNGAELEGLHIRVDLADIDKKKHNHKRSIFIGNISYQVEEEALRRHFADCGGIDNVRIIRDPKTGMGKGFGYITFQDASSVDLAIVLNGDALQGRELRIHRSIEKPPTSTKSSVDSSSKSPRHKNSMTSFEGRKKSVDTTTGDTRTAAWKKQTLGGGKERTPGSSGAAGSKTGATTKAEAMSQKRNRKKEIRRKSREKKKLSLGRLLTGVKKSD